MASIARNVMIVSGAAFVSRILGVLRTSVFAYRFGTGDVLAAYNAAFGIVDMIYLLIIGGALGSSLIPVFTSLLAKKREQEAWELASSVITYAFLAALIFSALLYILAPFLVPRIILPGESAAQQVLTVEFIRYLLIQPLILGLCGVFVAILNSFQQFLLTSIGPLIYNISIICGAAFFSTKDDIRGVIAGVIIGALAYLLFLIPGLVRLGFRFKPALSLKTAGLKRVLVLLGPRVLGQAVFHINFIALRAIASYDGSRAVTTLDYAYRLFYLPLGLIGVSMATVAFPALARLNNEQNKEEFSRTLARFLETAVFIILPIGLFLAFHAQGVISILFERGAFQQADTSFASAVFLSFLLCLPFVVLTEIMLRSFYALHDTVTPLIVSACAVALTLFLSFQLMPFYSTPGLAFSFSLSNILETLVFILIFVFVKKIIKLKSFLFNLIKMIAALLPFALINVFFYLFAMDFLKEQILLLKIGLLLLLFGISFIPYILAAWLLKIPAMRTAQTMLKRKFPFFKIVKKP